MSSSDSASTNTYSLNLLSLPLLQVMSSSTQSAAKATVNAVSSQFSGKEAEASVTIAPPIPAIESTTPPELAPEVAAPSDFHAISRSDTDDSIVSEASEDAAPEPIMPESSASTSESFEPIVDADYQAAPAYTAVDQNMLHGTPDSQSMVSNCLDS